MRQATTVRRLAPVWRSNLKIATPPLADLHALAHHMIFNLEVDDHIDVWHILPGQRDIQVWMREADETHP